jgi:hypothetical protein
VDSASCTGMTACQQKVFLLLCVPGAHTHRARTRRLRRLPAASGGYSGERRHDSVGSASASQRQEEKEVVMYV